ncbi:MAG: diphthine--ammonia ligase [Flaviaesturariibacter sp.]|nr:diphthine--ammonia ligase [Flaviaesturariibacter sp.]
MNWSGGKDSALCLHHAKQQGIPVSALLTSFNTATDRVSMHGIRRNLLQQQAVSFGLPLHTLELLESPGMEAYEGAIRNVHQSLQAEGYTDAVYGDIFLEDLKAYREGLLAKDGLNAVFPLWQRDSKTLLQEFFLLGFKAMVVCVNDQHLDKSFCGRLLDEAFLADLPPDVDPCGENGEYHSFVFDGPLFSNPVPFVKGDLVFKEYAAPKENKTECFTTPKPKAGFYFCDLLP